MSYLVLARKWRPQSFEELLGQDPVVKTLRNAILKGRIAHAYLFSGPRGVGKTSTARIFAKALNCVQGPTAFPCNSCEACLEITNGTAVDVLEIDGASHTGVDNIRELRETVAYKPIKLRYKVYIIDEVHMLSTSAFNALLKTLEEPPEHVVFIFATTEPQKVPLTVLSRCQRFEFRRIPKEVILRHLEHICEAEGIEATQEALRLLAEKASGSMRDAQSLLDQVAAYSGGSPIDGEMVREVLGIPDRSALRQVVDRLREGDYRGAAAVVDDLYERGVPLEEFLRELMGYLRDLLFEGDMDPFQLRFWLQLCLRAESQMRKGDLDRLILEVTLMEMAHWRDLLSLQEVLKRLQEAPASEERPSVQDNPQQVDEGPDLDWDGLLKAVCGESPILGAFLSQARCLKAEDGRLRIGVPSAFALERLSEREARDTLERVFGSCLGQRVKVELVLLEEASAVQRRPSGDSEAFVKEVLEVLGGTVVEERTL